MSQNKHSAVRLHEKVRLPKWAVIALAFGCVMAIVFMIATFNAEDRATTSTAQLKETVMRSTSLRGMTEYAEKGVLYDAANGGWFYLLILVVGLAVGLSHGIALVRVKRDAAPLFSYEDDEEEGQGSCCSSTSRSHREQQGLKRKRRR